MNLEFVSQISDFQLYNTNKYENWLNFVANSEDRVIGEIIYKFVSKEDILKINIDFLNHNYFTDIISFDESFMNELNGEIFICPTVVKENSKDHSQNDFDLELLRVILHGLLHLIGYKDYSREEKLLMRSKEDFYLQSFLEK